MANRFPETWAIAPGPVSWQGRLFSFERYDIAIYPAFDITRTVEALPGVSVTNDSRDY